MTLPRRVAEALARFGVPADTVAAVDDLYHHLGSPVVEAVSEIVEEHGLRPTDLRPEDLAGVRTRVGARYLREHHAEWRSGRSTPGFWRDRGAFGVATGLVVPLGDLERPESRFLTRLAEAVRLAGGKDQPPARGLLCLSQNAHRGNQEGTLAFDLVPSALEEALALNSAEGRQHTLPGSVGEASGRALGEPPLALLWEAQPNLYKPSAERNREASKAYRRHRLWPLVTTCAALAFLVERGYRVFVLKGRALRAAHEVDPAQPLGPRIEALHDRSFARAAAALGYGLADCAEGDVPGELARLAKVNLGREVERRGLAPLVRQVRSQTRPE